MKVGDRVLVTTNYDRNRRVYNEIATIIGFEDECLALEFSKDVIGHDCNGLGRYRYCWYVHEKYCIPVVNINSIKYLLYKREDKQMIIEEVRTIECR